MAGYVRWGLVAGVFVLVAVVPIVFYRYTYTHSKRLREVVSGRVYRSGQMTAPGFERAVREFGIRTIVNLQDDVPDPDIREGYFTTQTVKESALCRRLGVRYVHLAPDLVPRNSLPERRPQVLAEYLALMDDPDIYPVLLHCRAGLHRTGMLVAVYRMEYQGWGPGAALREVKHNGFGESTCTTANDYIIQYVLNYQSRPRQEQEASAGAAHP
jgi:protein tyrosine/serine phosphatase